MSSSRTTPQRPMMRLLVKSMPQGFRRLILLSSLIAFISNTNKPEKAFIRNMDAALKLSKGAGSSGLEFPVRLSRVFWGNQEVFRDEIAVLTNEATSEAEKETAASKIVQIVPEVFGQETRQSIIKDLVHYFSQHPQLSAA